MLIRNLRAVPVLLRYSGFRKISIGRKGLSEPVPLALARSHNLIRDVSRRVIELVYEDGELEPAQQVAEARATQAAAPAKAASVEKAPDAPPKLDGIGERMLERLRMLKPASVPSELARLRRMADMNPLMAGTVARVVEAYESVPAAPSAVPPVAAPAAAPGLHVAEAATASTAATLVVHSDVSKLVPAEPKDKYSRTSVRKMRKDELVAMAVEIGVPGAPGMDVLRLRCALLDKLPA